MARGKKAEKMLTLEEKLERALVSVEEQPYSIPENWCWVSLQNLCLIPITDGTHKTPTYCDKENGVPFISAKDVTSQFINWENVKYITKELHEELYHRIAPQPNDILLAKNGTTGVAALVENEKVFDIYVTLAVLRANCALVTPQYLFRLVNSPVCQNQFDEHLTGIGVPNLHLRDIKVTKIPLAPLPEQQRIVDRIESLFAKLDEAKEKAQAVVDGFELRKSAILHKAFAGELTKRWRKAHGVELDSWQNKFLKNVCQYMKAGGDKPADFVDTKDSKHCIPVVANGITEDGIIGYTAEAKYESGTVTVSGRGTIGYSIYRDYPIYPVVRLIVLCPTKDILPKFLKYVFDAYPEEGTGSSIPQLTVPSIKEKNIPIPIREEQAEIVQILDELFAKEQQAKAAAESVLDQIDTMKKAILARAFRGELGTNDPTEESAVELLKTVL